MNLVGILAAVHQRDARALEDDEWVEKHPPLGS